MSETEKPVRLTLTVDHAVAEYARRIAFEQCSPGVTVSAASVLRTMLREAHAARNRKTSRQPKPEESK